MNYRTSLDENEKAKLRSAKVCLAGCGGLGGYIAEYLLRLNIGALIAVDGDVFSESNLNRQLLCTEESLGKSKAEAVKQRAREIKSKTVVTSVREYLTEDNAEKMISDCDIVIDALDSLAARKILHSACKKRGIPMVFGAIGAWRVQFAVLMPDCRFLDRMEEMPEYHGEDMLSFIPALCASYQVAEAVKLLCGAKSEYENKLCDIDLLINEKIEIEL